MMADDAAAVAAFGKVARECWTLKRHFQVEQVGASRNMSGSLGMGVKMMGKKSIPIEGLGKMNCDFASMDAPARSSQESSRSDVLPKSGNMSADMDAALKKLENRRVAAALNQHVPPQPQTTNRERGQAQFVRSRRNSAASNKSRPKRLKIKPI
jgi:hypothetical protein